ncbi:styrene-oxide isomerase StyC [Bordetella genomosp. 12]|uniref:Styrene-oxide isomerase n=1 Tax=Bordetella genomosp. 12 TaxID=463035 RepID=A0A261VMA2_9BORD|nr:hypothetical protein [Bordetella genomosp. 12]OZI74622.1 hypothetical protein CAL22_09195 [Bordetella genomosp. 12]
MDKSFQQRMAGHGVLMIFCTLLFGLGLWMKLLEGFELYPGFILPFNIPGTPEGWARAHVGPALNGMMVIAVAFVLPGLHFKEGAQKWLGWIVVADGWSNVIFYLFSNFASNRGLSFGGNRFGPGDVFGVIALAPAYLFGVLAMVALIVIGWAAVRPRSGQAHARRAEAA